MYDPKDFQECVELLRRSVRNRGWKVNSRNRNGKHYVTVVWGEDNAPVTHRMEPRQVRELVNEVFAHATMTSYAAYSNAVFRTNPEKDDD